jgi:hypothetical protein
LLYHERVTWSMGLVILIVLASVSTTLRAEAHAGDEIETLVLREKMLREKAE